MRRTAFGRRLARWLTPGVSRLRQVGRAQEALYPLAACCRTVDRFFLAFGDHAVRHAPDAPTGVMHVANEAGERGGFSVYIPENYDPARAHPLVMALHGGSGHGRLFLWSWLREVRGRGVILVSSTAVGDTWSFMEPQVDSENLAHVLEQVAQPWQVDRTRLLLTGMSDGGTFTLFSGLETNRRSPIWRQWRRATIRCC